MELPTQEPEARGRARASVFGFWEYDNQNYGRDFTTPDAFCSDPFAQRDVWHINDIIAVHHGGRWHGWSQARWSTHDLLLALEEQAELLGRPLDLSPWRGGRGFPSRDEVLALLRPDLTDAERRLWLCFGGTATSRATERVDGWWLDVPEDWRDGVSPAALTLVDGDDYLLGELSYSAYVHTPGYWLDSTLGWAEYGVGGGGPPEAHIRDVEPDLQADRACRLGCHLFGPMSDISPAMDAWAVRLAGLGRLVEPLRRWPEYRSDQAGRLERPLIAVDRSRLTASQVESLASVVMSVHAAARSLADRLHELAETRRPPDAQAYGELLDRCEELMSSAMVLYRWPLEHDAPMRTRH